MVAADVQPRLQTVVVSQSMYFPWCGLLDQIRQADVFVYYDDVQLVRGFCNRVQVKTLQGYKWITVPLLRKSQKQLIHNTYINYEEDWVSKHRSILINSYRQTKFIDDAIALFDSVHSNKYERLCELARASIFALSKYFKLNHSIRFLDSTLLVPPGKSSQRLCDITKMVDGKIYLTGHGAINYLDHGLFDRNGIEVRYMNYSIQEYQQVFGAFTPYVTALDAISHLGTNANKILNSQTENWKEAIKRLNKLQT